MNEKKWQVLLDELQQEFCQANLNHTEELAKMFVEHAPPSKFPRVLDIGVGEGCSEIDVLEARGYSVHGISIIPWMDESTRITIMDMHDQKFPLGSFDAAFSTQVFEHSYSPWLLLMETWVTIRKEGRLFISLPYYGTHVSVHHPSDLPFVEWAYAIEQVGFDILYNEDKSILREKCTIIVAEKGKPPTMKMRKALGELEKLRIS